MDSAEKKVTLLLPEELLARAQEVSGVGITPTVRRGLELLAAGAAFEKLRKLRGRVKLGLDLRRLRDDR